MEILKNKKGLTGFDIKIMALIFMLLDHIHYFFEYTGNIPLVFSWIGRIAGGLFLFTMIEGYTHTSNIKKYFLRIYLMGMAMAIVKYAIQILPFLQRGDGFIPMNGIFQTFTVLIILFKAIDLIKEKKFIKGILLFILPFIIPMGIYQIANIIPSFVPYAYLIVSVFIPMPLMVEGGIFLLLSGLILYIFKNNRKNQSIIYILFILIWMVGIPVAMIRPISLKLMFTDYYEWMGALAGFIFLLYNGEKGKSMKKLFYIFYPAHIYILYFLSLILYK